MSKVNPVLFVVTANVPPQMEDEFNEWYNHTHVPEVLGCPGWLSARRFKAVEGAAGSGAPKYLALYELEDASATETEELGRVRGWGKFTPHITDHIKRVYQQIYPIITE